MKIQLVVPVGKINETFFSNTINHIHKQQENIMSIFFVIEKHQEKNVQILMAANFNCDFSILEIEENTTKMEKLAKVSSLLSDDAFVLVLDTDDYLLDLEKVLKIIPEESDLFLSPYDREFELNGRKNNRRMKLGTNLQWESENANDFIPTTGMAYFGNHSTLVKGSLFKEVNDLFLEFDFQRHEDIIRNILYISKSEFSAYQDFYPIIQRNIISGHNHTLNEKDENKIYRWVEKLLFNISEMEIDFKDPWTIYGKSQFSGIYDIFITATHYFDKGNDERDSFKKFFKKYKQWNEANKWEKYTAKGNGWRKLGVEVLENE